MSKSVLYGANINSQAVLATGSVINFGSIVRKYGCNCTLSGGNAEVTGCGYYAIDVNVSFSSSVAGAATIQLYKDGVVIPGAKAVVTISATGDVDSVTIPAIIKQNCNCTDTITAEITGLNGNVTNAAITVIKL